MKDHELEAHCNVSVLPPRSAGRHTPLDEFERDVRQTLGDKLETVSAATEWETKRGNHCLGVIADGKVGEVPIEWRNYLVSADDCPRLSLTVTLKRELTAQFADAERQIIDSLELIPAAAPEAETASAGMPSLANGSCHPEGVSATAGSGYQRSARAACWEHVAQAFRRAIEYCRSRWGPGQNAKIRLFCHSHFSLNTLNAVRKLFTP